MDQSIVILFPKADELALEHWDPEKIAECMEMVRHAKPRATDAFRQSDFWIGLEAI